MERRLPRRPMIVTVSEPKTVYMQRLHPQLKVCWGRTNGYDTEPPRQPSAYAAVQRRDDRVRPHRPAVQEPQGLRLRRSPWANPPFRSGAGRAGARASSAASSRRSSAVTTRSSPSTASAISMTFAGDVSHGEAMDAQVNCDYLLLIVDTGETSDGVILQSSSSNVRCGARSPPLCDPGATQQIIDKAGLGKTVPAESRDACEAMLREWLARPAPEIVEADDAYSAQFDRKAITERFARPCWTKWSPGSQREAQGDESRRAQAVGQGNRG